ncbi:MAG: RNA polymerase sigma factor [Planctomycetes bacterium]|nr:RNA polymerase sigma factor [Planctomycetota bacterium]
MAEFVRFQSTLWSRIRLVQQRDARAVTEFVNRYRPPVLYFIHNAGFTETDAEDLAQEVFTRLLADDALSKADQQRGRFRSFLIAVARNVIREERRRRRTVPRSGLAEPAAREPADEDFDHAWVGQLLDSALRVLEAERPLHHRALAAHVLDGKTYEQIAAELGRSLQDVRNFIHRSRQRLTELLREEIWRYSSSREEYEDEIRALAPFLHAKTSL